jgi:hypothetical protein
LPGKRSVVRSMQQPIVSMLSCLGRYGYGSRSDHMPPEHGATSIFGHGADRRRTSGMVPIEVANCGFSALTGEVWIPAGGLMAYFSDVRMHYIAGFPGIRHSGCDQSRGCNSR